MEQLTKRKKEKEKGQNMLYTTFLFGRNMQCAVFLENITQDILL